VGTPSTIRSTPAHPARYAAAVFDNGTREQRAAIALASLLVVLRCVMPTIYEGYYFDSDQAIVGLMAKRLAEFREFPLFYYGLNYLLGVQAWIVAPFFWIARPSVAVMRLPLVILNVAVAVALVAGLSRRLALRPALALVTALPFIIPPPATSAYLLQTAGASVEPFVYVLLLWRLRGRPLAFGALLAVGYLHREFVIFTVPALALVEAAHQDFWTARTAQRAGWIALGFAAVWLVIDDLRMHLSGAALAGQVASLGNQMCVTPAELPGRIHALFGHALPAAFGAARGPVAAFGMNTPVAAGSLVVGALMGTAVAIMIVRLLLRRDPVGAPSTGGGFGPYLALVGAFTACAYPLSCNVAAHAPPLLRYLLLALLVPVGVCATFLSRERSAALRRAAIAVFLLWAGMNVVDNARVVTHALADPPGSEHRLLANYLVDHGIRYARAIYWDAYVLDFFTRERVVVSSVDVTRIPEYERAVDAHAAAALNLQRLPCEGPVKVASWCVTR
jgi:hypothetical protein